MPSIPVDVLREILEHVDENDDLATLCRVNKIFCSCSQDVLYRNIYYGDEPVVRTLAQSTDLAIRVRWFTTACDSPELAMALRNMSSLRLLELWDYGDVSVLDGCTFKLDTFTCSSYYSEPLQQFLNSQPSITHVVFFKGFESMPLDERCLPNLTRVWAPTPWLRVLIPGRPVREVMTRSDPGIDLSFFTLSTTPIQKLEIPFDGLYPKPVSLLVSTFPSLVHLEAGTSYLDSTTIPDVDEYIVNLLAALVHLRIFEFSHISIKDINQFIMKVSDRVPHLEYFSMPRLNHYYKRVGGKLVICGEREHPGFEL